MITKQEVANFLIQEGYMLTALEFHQELLEDGNELDVLKKQFGAPPPQNSDAYTLTTENAKLPDNVEAAMKEKDDRITLLEYELRMAKGQVNNLKEKLKTNNAGSLQKSTNMAASAPTLNRVNSRTDIVSDLEKENPKDIEVRAVNFLVMRYLLTRGYKLSAVTFEEEVSDHSVSDWDGVGINSVPPPSLLTFYRYFYSVDPSSQAAALKNTSQDNLIAALKDEIEQLKKRALKAEEKLAHSKKKNDKLLADKKVLEDKLTGYENGTLSPKDTAAEKKEESKQEATPATSPEPAAKKTRKARRTYAEVDPNPFTITEVPESYSRISNELKIIATETDLQSVVHIVGDALPHIVPGVILKKREELIPVILSAISQHPDPNTRYNLTHLLFNLIKRPSEYERKVLVDGFDALAQIIGEERTEREFLPQCCEQIHDEHDERRVLVAESCGAAAKYVRSELRPSLIFSILQQLCQDRSHLVRKAVARNLAVLISYFDTIDKYMQIEEIVFELLNDSSEEVRKTAIKVLLPIFSDWSDSNEWLCSKFLNKFLNEIETQLSSNEDVVISTLFNGFKTVIPRLKETILWAIPIPETITDAAKKLKYREDQLNSIFEREVTDHNIPELEWLLSIGLPKFVLFIHKVDFSKDVLVHDFINVFHTFCTTFGEIFATTAMKKAFAPQLEKEHRGKVLPIYLAGVVSCIKKRDVFPYFFKQMALSIALEENGWKRIHKDALRESVKIICKSDRKDEIFGVLGELMVHTANPVRLLNVSLLDALVTVLHADEISRRIMPVLVTLSADPEQLVRADAIRALGLVAMNVEEPTILDKIKQQFSAYIADDTAVNRSNMVKVFTMILPKAQANFRDTFIMPNLVRITDRNSKSVDKESRNKLAPVLFECYRAYTSCLIEVETVKETLLPGLRLLQKEEGLDTSSKQAVATMISELEVSMRAPIEDKQPVPPPPAPANSNPQLGAWPSRANFMNVLSRVAVGGAPQPPPPPAAPQPPNQRRN